MASCSSSLRSRARPHSFVRTAICCVVALTWLWAAAAEAEVTGSVLLKGGTLGFGPELDLRFPQSSFGLRIDADGFGFSDDDVANCRFRYSETAYGYDARVRLGGSVRLLNGGLAADYYPFGNGFRLSAGAVINGNQVTARGVPEGQLRLGTTSIGGTLPGRVDASADVQRGRTRDRPGLQRAADAPSAHLGRCGRHVRGRPRICRTG